MEIIMRGLLLKVGFLLAIWYEVAAELRVGGGTAFVITLLGLCTLMMLVRLPGQVLAMIGPTMFQFIAPMIVWVGLAWWLMPTAFTSFPALALIFAGLLATIGAATHYLVTCYPQWFETRWPMIKGAVSPLGCGVLWLANHFAIGALSLIVMAALLLMPLRVGWRFIAPATAERFDAKMGNHENFRRDGYSDEL
jgi:hypothetical protein